MLTTPLIINQLLKQIPSWTEGKNTLSGEDNFHDKEWDSKWEATTTTAVNQYSIYQPSSF